MTPKDEKSGDQARELELIVEKNRDVFLVMNGDLFSDVVKNLKELNSSEQNDKRSAKKIVTRLVGNLLKFFSS